jgi:hypothetical protein
LHPARLFIAPVLAAAAAGLSFWVNVPDELPVRTPSPPPAKDRAQTEKAPGGVARKPRAPEEIDRLWNRHASVDLANEPVDRAWSRAQQEILTRVTAAARQSVFARAPEPTQVVVGPRRCHTVRCRFSMCSPLAHEVHLLDRAIQGAKVDGTSPWRHYDARISKPGNAMSPDDFCLEVTVAFASDDPDPTRIAFPDERESESARKDERDGSDAKAKASD